MWKVTGKHHDNDTGIALCENQIWAAAVLPAVRQT